VQVLLPLRVEPQHRIDVAQPGGGQDPVGAVIAVAQGADPNSSATPLLA
jgi:hypothetical protein